MKDFFFNIFRSNTQESSKRVFGGVGYITAIFFVAFFRRDLVDLLMYLSASLLGLETITNIFNNVTNRKNK